MTKIKFDYTQSSKDIFYSVLYPLYAKEFMYSNSYKNFKLTVEANFMLNAEQWEYIAEHWANKEAIKIKSDGTV